MGRTKKWYRGRAARLSSAKAPTAVRIRSIPLKKGSQQCGPFLFVLHFTVLQRFGIRLNSWGICFRTYLYIDPISSYNIHQLSTTTNTLKSNPNWH